MLGYYTWPRIEYLYTMYDSKTSIMKGHDRTMMSSVVTSRTTMAAFKPLESINY